MNPTVANIDVVGGCNLACPSCPNGTEARKNRPGGLMPPERLGRILEKLAHELAPRGPELVNLYSWGEPLLHPQIGELVRLVKAAGYRCGLSSNLNDASHLESALRAGPDHLKVSVSGFTPGPYAAWHVRGDVYRLRGNLHLLRSALDRTGARTRVTVAYLLHRHNAGADFIRMQDLAAELGLGFEAHFPFLMPADRMLASLEGRATAEDQRVVDQLVIPPRRDQALVAPSAQLGRGCTLRERDLDLNPDGSVELCCGVFSLPPVARDYLETPLAEIQRRRDSHPFCAGCQQRQVDLVYAGATAPGRQALGLELLAELRKAGKGAAAPAVAAPSLVPAAPATPTAAASPPAIDVTLARLAAAPDSAAHFRAFLEAIGARLGPGAQGSFLGRLLGRLHGACDARQEQNRDTLRFGDAAEEVRPLASGAEVLTAYLQQRDRFERAWRTWADDRSREWMVDLAAMRILGGKRVRLSTNCPSYWEAKRRAERDLVEERDVVPLDFLGWSLHRYGLAPEGVPVQLYSHPAALLPLALLRQYQLTRGAVRIGPRTGDRVIDAGGCWGDSAIWFAHHVGPAGRVHTFEFVPANLRIFESALALNPTLRERVELVTCALWDRSRERIAYDEAGPGTHVGSGAASAPTVTLDDFVAERGLLRVDFVKMDIEGAEPAVLRGAAETLRRHRPRLAIAAYHRLDDLAEIPLFLAGLGVGYRIYLDHFTLHDEESVIFADAA